MPLSSVASDWPAPDAEAPVTESWTAMSADASGLVAEPIDCSVCGSRPMPLLTSRSVRAASRG